MKKQLKGKQSFYDDKQRENVVSYYLMEDQEHTMYGVELEKYQEETNVIEWDAVPSISESMEHLLFSAFLLRHLHIPDAYKCSK